MYHFPGDQNCKKKHQARIWESAACIAVAARAKWLGQQPWRMDFGEILFEFWSKLVKFWWSTSLSSQIVSQGSRPLETANDREVGGSVGQPSLGSCLPCLTCRNYHTHLITCSLWPYLCLSFSFYGQSLLSFSLRWVIWQSIWARKH